MTNPTPQAPESIDTTSPAYSIPPRLRSVDALRGFDMFWIVGAGSVVRALGSLGDNPTTRYLSNQLRHVRWEGFNFYDLVFPLFLFIVGISIVLSVDKSLARTTRARVVLRIFRRALLIYLLGVLYYGGFAQPWPDIQLSGVLQRIALCYLAAALLYCFLPPIALYSVTVALLLGYWALLAFVPFPELHLDKATVQEIAVRIGSDSPAAISAAVPNRVVGVYDEGYNLTNYLDFRFLPGRKSESYYINEGLLSTLPSIAICLAGIFAGRLLQSQAIAPDRKVICLLIAGIAAVLIAYYWGQQFPIIKRIWTSSSWSRAIARSSSPSFTWLSTCGYCGNGASPSSG